MIQLSHAATEYLGPHNSWPSLLVTVVFLYICSRRDQMFLCLNVETVPLEEELGASLLTQLGETLQNSYIVAKRDPSSTDSALTSQTQS